MKDKKYPVKCFRLSDETYNKLVELKNEDLSWNLFFYELIKIETGYVCSECGSPKKVQKHHIIALKDGGEDTEENKKLLCFKCHKKTHNWGNKRL